MDLLWAYEQAPPSGRGLAAVGALESRYRIQLPDDFRAYLLEAAPDKDWWHDQYYFVLWAPERIKSISDECGEPKPEEPLNPQIDNDRYLVFADFLDWCGYAYAICCSEGPDRGKVAMIGTRPHRLVAVSLASFFKLMTEDSMRLHSPGGDHYTDIT
ncbi:hypothetical protein ABAC402_18415 [Asticcacaulis sp. AC402]|nr:hypothetical protein ABAC402_18415 [Asticcacaulis sp. AC402]